MSCAFGATVLEARRPATPVVVLPVPGGTAAGLLASPLLVLMSSITVCRLVEVRPVAPTGMPSFGGQ
jgi:hypothetical protein